MCKLVQILRLITRDGISSLTSFRVETEPKPSFSSITRNYVTRAQKIGFLRFEMHNLAFEDLKDSTKNLCFEFEVIPN